MLRELRCALKKTVIDWPMLSVCRITTIAYGMTHALKTILATVFMVKRAMETACVSFE